MVEQKAIQVINHTPAFDWTAIIIAIITAVIGPAVLYWIRKRRKE